MKENRFYYCEICGNIIGKIHDSGVPVVCCGQDMTRFDVHTEDGPYDKHKPIIKLSGNMVNVKIGSTEHPMSQEHHITWIYLLTEKGGQRKNLKIADKPDINFSVVDDKPIGVFSHCNIHGLWYADVE